MARLAQEYEGRELVFVGLFVLIAGAVLLGTVLAISGVFGASGTVYRAYFPFAGGLGPGASVRYAGGPQVGRVERVQLDPADPGRYLTPEGSQPFERIEEQIAVKGRTPEPLAIRITRHCE